jgi:hypothetical protein
MKKGPIPAWLDEATAALVEEIVNLRDLCNGYLGCPFSNVSLFSRIWLTALRHSVTEIPYSGFFGPGRRGAISRGVVL